ncbi:3-hydroxyisobutyrate dehydrogenase [Corynebacterium phocae]|uniref:3-hydroxyisobutyrate dehydrogenase n=1 Tax=Corynebacterium phocae TaxID=161895 RepID=A0A1L7D3S7_9CORY|nr:3-hydroxyisobutyrate dehydrogenase [Corynebacterium phocae]APT92661.1 3-hydroxyisobutyrate dehydrogenase [Corynebacterium phocae]KAA8723714.1 3-hydroxyisobutyrate dehydrogenase [Corynebacterium phocae]
MKTIAVIGLGNMGGPMAANLAKEFNVRGFDVSDKARAALDAPTFDTAEEAAQGADAVLTMLPNGELVKKVIGSLLEADNGEKLYIDSSTIAVSDAREVAQMVQEAGSHFVDAPVSGGVAGATAGTLAFMVGGEEEAFAAAKPYLEVMGRSITHCGVSGNGQAVKACNNMILAVHQIVLAEALVLGERLGLDHQAFFDVVSNATGNSWALSVNAPVPDVVPGSPANNNFKPGFASALMLKDLNLAMVSAEETGTDTVLGKIAAEQYAKFVDSGHAGLDFSAIINEVRAKGQ